MTKTVKVLATFEFDVEVPDCIEDIEGFAVDATAAEIDAVTELGYATDIFDYEVVKVSNGSLIEGTGEFDFS